MSQAQSVKDQVSGAAARHEVAKWVPKLFRTGYAAKGVVYAIIGFLAAKLAFGPGGETTDSKGALQEIAEASWGTWALGLVGIGLVGYSLWKFVQAIRDPERKGSDAEGLIKRAGFFGSGLIHASLAFTALSMAFGSGGGGGGSNTQSMTATLSTIEDADMAAESVATIRAQLQQATATTGLKLSRNLRREEILRLLDSGET